MTPYEYLKGLREDIPSWLDRLKDLTSFPREEFFGSRVVYYPGSGTDGHPIKVFGSTHSAHCFVYADYHVAQADLEKELQDPRHRARGYHTWARLQLCERDLVPDGWTAHLHPHDVPADALWFASVAKSPFGFLEVLERDDDQGDEHGARRLAVLFLGADGIATYDALFCQDGGESSPFAVLLQDHAFGGNWTRFGRGGLLERIATKQHALPDYMLVAENTAAWYGFERVPGVERDRGGVAHMRRFLYKPTRPIVAAKTSWRCRRDK